MALPSRGQLNASVPRLHRRIHHRFGVRAPGLSYLAHPPHARSVARHGRAPRNLGRTLARLWDLYQRLASDPDQHWNGCTQRHPGDRKAALRMMVRVVSFLPAATEIAYALGAGDCLVGRSHECDYPPQVKDLPVVSRPSLPIDQLEQSEIDAAVSEKLGSGQSLYLVDELLLRQLRPDFVFTQDLCQVCAPSGNELTRALAEMSPRPTMIWLTPRNLTEIEENILSIGDAT